MPLDQEALLVPEEGVLPLWNAPSHRTAIDLYESACISTRILPPGWQGTDGETSATLHMEYRIDRGALEPAIAMHPPYHGGVHGAIRTEFLADLPDIEPLSLVFRYAIRDDDAGGARSDGVTFRVRISPGDAEAGAAGELQFEDHTEAKEWRDGAVDLSALAGTRVRIQLEANPGPARDNTCDLAYWGRPRVVAGTTPETEQDVEPHPEGEGIRLGALDQSGVTYTVDLFPGKRGLLDGHVRFTSPHGSLAFHGIEVEVAGDALHAPGGLWRLRKVRREAGAVDHWVHHFSRGETSLDLAVDLRLESGALHVAVRLENAPEATPWNVPRIERVALGPWSTGFSRVYAGMGNVLEEPEAFTLHFDGHHLATSHVGADFGHGYALVQSTDTPPLRLEAVPNENRLSLIAEDDTTFTLVPSANVWMAARTWRAAQKQPAAPEVAALAGRFVFDLWGGHYAESAKRLEEAFAYGLTHSVVIWHNWQRWGYDYRLPDILPPNPAFGSEDDFKTLIAVCRAHGVPFVLHDNYIDIYPDANGFSYDQVAMTAQHEPVRGWLNEYRQSQAYRWRPDRYPPALESNLSRIAHEYAPTGYFVDVWASARPHSFWTNDGQYYSAAFTRDAWAASFDRIRFLLDGAPTLSESGTDQLIGHVGGATANHLRVDPDPPGNDYFTWRVRAADAERIPWFNMAWHDRFVLHGAGYENRYAAGLDLANHGIYSDDYICTEVLSGHPGMAKEAFGIEVLRKYWLTDGLAQALAGVPMGWVNFDNDDIHRLYVHWENGGDVWVNRGTTDWQGKTHRLPPYGFYAAIPRENPHTEAAIEYIDGVMAEWARTPDRLYVNARPPNPDINPLTLTGATLGEDAQGLALALEWHAERPLTKDYRVYVHAVDELGVIQFQGDHDPKESTSAWEGAQETTAHLRLPSDARPGDVWPIRVGLYLPGGGERVKLIGARDGGPLLAGTLELDSEREAVFTPAPAAADLLPVRENLTRAMLDFGAVATNGACLISGIEDGLKITPLPGSDGFEILIPRQALFWALPQVSSLVAEDETGTPLALPEDSDGRLRVHVPSGVAHVVLRATSTK
jgi:hypothetical protein